MAEKRHGYFCLSGVARYQCRENLVPGVPRELRTVREALTGVGLTELFAFTADERGHADLLLALASWAREPAADSTDETLVIYCTGHGTTVGTTDGWFLVGASSPPNPMTSQLDNPDQLVEAALARDNLKQVVLILDACFAGDGAEQTLDRSFPVARSLAKRSGKDLWILAAASRLDTATPMVFAEAWKAALPQTGADLLDEPYLEPANVMDRVRALSKQAEDQSPRLVAGDSHGCHALPNPLYMPSELPGLDPPWDTAARGVAQRTDPGWYFVPWPAVHDVLLEHITGSDREPAALQLVGSHGTGKTALLGRLITTATAEQRAAMPVVARIAAPTSDLDLVASDCHGRDLRRVVEDLGRRVGAPGASLEELAQQLAGRQCVVLDHADSAVDPEEITGTLIAAILAAGARLVVAASRPLPGLEGAVLVDLDDTGRSDPPPIAGYVRTRLLRQHREAWANQQHPQHPQTRAVNVAADRIGRICHGNFSAAVSEVNELIRTGASVKSGAPPVSNGANAQLDRLCRKTMAEACQRHRLSPDPDGWAATLIGVLSVLCQGCTIGLPAVAWAQVAHHLDRQAYPVAGVAACAADASAFLRAVDDRGVIRYRPRYDRPLPPGRRDPPPGRAADALLAFAGWPDVTWSNQDPGVTEVLAHAAAQRLGSAGQLLDDRRFLLGVPPAQISSALKMLGEDGEPARRNRAWDQVPIAGTAAQRSFALSLGTARAGLQAAHDSARADPGQLLEVVTALALPRGTASIIGVAAISGGAARTAVTSHDDGSVSLWDLDAGRPAEHLSDASQGSAIREVGAYTVAGAVHVLVLGTDGTIRCWRPDEEACEPAGPTERADALAVHACGLIAVLTKGTVAVQEGCQARTRFRSTHRSRLRGMHFAGPESAPVLWLHYEDGTLQRWPVLTQRAPVTVALAPTTYLFAAAPDGSTAALVDASGNWTVAGTRRPTLSARSPSGSVRQADPPRAALMDDDWLMLAGGHGSRQPWLRLIDLTTSAVFTFPLDDSPAGMSGCHEGGLVLATSRGCAVLRPRLSPQARTASDERRT